ncbi:Alpha/Beta hydrolase protein [Clohesyomyces aquaticus]|uniref:Alpha/Beta hydrolase protein n=1 Tax=Clohesyomyces aquaticus TaxID=1231657 RepID=A0A1Y1YT33_9PLEO|nr:Alpha/Beta hydrolase protein [Clohesyomyces aquaticus]
MQPFTLNLSSDLDITGLSSIPPSPPSPSPPRPLLILLHGGGYSASYFSASASTSIEPLSTALSIPVLSLNRQGYQASTPVPPLSPGQTSLHTQARNFNDIILPALWEEYGEVSGATSIVLAGHSVGGFIAVMVAGMYSSSSSSSGKKYPLSGLCLTGVADKVNPVFETVEPPQPPLDPSGKFVLWPDELRDSWLLMIPSGLADPDFPARHAELNNPAPIQEVSESMARDPEWKSYMKDVEVPVLALVGEFDGLWDTREEVIRKFGERFGKADVETGVVRQGPHCLELSFQWRGAYLKVLGHAVQCAVGYEIQKEEKE